MRRSRLRVLGMIASLSALAACGTRHDSKSTQGLEVFDAEEAAPASQSANRQIAYSYSLSYLLANDRIGDVQADHIQSCKKLGLARCVLISDSLSRGDTYTSAKTALLVDARLAPRLGKEFDKAVADAGGDVSERGTEAEDVTTQLIDTGARIRAKQALSDRLLRLIQSTDAKVGDLVAAEKAFAEVQEQLDAARQTEAVLRQRVTMSRLKLSYSSTAATGSWAPVYEAMRGAGQTLASSVAGLVTFVVAALPWLVVLSGLIWFGRRRGWRLRFWRPKASPAVE